METIRIEAALKVFETTAGLETVQLFEEVATFRDDATILVERCYYLIRITDVTLLFDCKPYPYKAINN